MASMSGAHTVQSDLVRGTIAEVKQLTVGRLKEVLRGESLQVSGVKNELQTRLIAHIYDCERRNDQNHLRRIRDAARGYSLGNSNTGSQYNSAPNPYPSPYSNHTPASSASPQYYASPTPRLPPPASIAMPNGYSQNRVTFKNSPFYTIQKQLSNVVELKPREQTRDTARITINLDAGLASRLQSDSSCRAMVFCAAESFDSAWKSADIAFPSHAELRCNQEDVKANLRGLKNKPGSTRPADITPFLKKKAAYPNNLELIYALTTKDKIQKYLLLVNLVQKRSIDSLVDDLKRGKYLSRDRVIREMQAKTKDDDIVATSSNMSLKDPVQMTRIETPCRSMNCKHNECFDAAVFLALQEQAPTWTCPICSKPAAWDALVYDLFVQDILRSTDAETEQVTIEPDGNWHLIKNESDTGNSDNAFVRRQDSDYDDDDDDDDLVEISNLEAPRTVTTIRTRPSFDSVRTPSLNGSSLLPPPQPSPAAQSPSFNSLQPSSQAKKRPREEVIDLTLSDDDDEPPVSRIKRPSLSSQVSTDTNRLSGIPSGPLRFNLPPPMPRMESPGRFYEFDHFNTRL